jgi:hypothetical protein
VCIAHVDFLYKVEGGGECLRLRILRDEEKGYNCGEIFFGRGIGFLFTGALASSVDKN